MEVRTSMGQHEKTKAKVSVVIPIGHSIKALERCLARLLDQSYNDYDIWIIDGSSTDDVKKVINEFQNRSSKIRYLCGEFLSKAAAWNRGIMESEANIIMMTDTDCEVPREWISDMIKPITSGEVIVQGGEEIASIGFWQRMQQRSNERLIADSSDGKYIENINTNNIAFRRSVLLDVGLFNRHIRTLEDYDIKLRLKNYGYKIYHLENVRILSHINENFLKFFQKKMKIGKWTYFLYHMNRSRISRIDEELFKSLRIPNFLLFFPRTLLILFTRGILAFIFELISGTALRIGIIMGFLKRRSFLRSIQANYD
jgi:cellulose synthase/poly-beta-1,6-N-acetylglucosamine synthase-like glycosyltransferase